MDKNRTEGTEHEIKGDPKEVAGKVTGNHAKEAAGNIEIIEIPARSKKTSARLMIKRADIDCCLAGG